MTSTGTSKAKATSADTGRNRSRRSNSKPIRGQSKRHPSIMEEEGNSTPPRTVTKRDQLAALLVRDGGATIDEMREATGWLPHTVRAALTGLKKLGYGIDSDKVDGVRTYRTVAPQ